MLGEALFVVPFSSLAAVCLALGRIGRRDNHGLLWRIGALAAAVPPLGVVFLLLVEPSGQIERAYAPALMGSVFLSAPLAAVMAWVVAVTR
jgi:hypothetical protein